MRRLVRAVFVAVVVSTAPVAGPAFASPAGDRIMKLVAGADRLFALRPGSLDALDSAGRTLRRCRPFDPAPARRQPRTASDPEPEEVLADAGLPDDDDASPEAEEALEDEGIGRRVRRPPAPEAPIELRDLAASPSANDVWIASSAGLYRSDDRSCARAGLPGRDLLLVARAGGTVAAASEQMLWRLDDGSPPAVVTGLESRPRSLAFDGAGRVLVGDDDGLVQVEADGSSTRVFDGPIGALAVCDGVAVALAADGAYAWAGDEAPARVADRPPVRALACGRSVATRFIATGVGVWTSPDGARWTEQDPALGRSVTSAAETERIWLAIDDQLVPLDDRRAPLWTPAAIAPSSWAPISTAGLRPPLVPWPRVSVAFAAHETSIVGTAGDTTRAGWSVILLLSFPLERRAGRGAEAADAASLGAALLERDAALATEEVELSSRPSSDEAEAKRHALAQERAALR